MRKFQRNAWQSEEFFESNYFQIGQHVVLLPINYRASKNVRAKTIQFILNWTVCKN